MRATSGLVGIVVVGLLATAPAAQRLEPGVGVEASSLGEGSGAVRWTKLMRENQL